MKHAGRLLTDVICLLISYYSAGLNLYLLPSVVPAVAFAAFLCINSQERKMLLPAAVCGLLSPYPLLRFPVGYAVLVLPQLRLKNRRHRWMIVIEGCVFLAAVHVVKPEDIFVMATVGVGTMVSLIRILPWACIVLLAAEMYFLNKASGMEERLYQVEKIDAAAARQMEQIAGRDKAILKISHHIRKHLGEMSEQNEVLYNALQEIDRETIYCLNPYIQAVIADTVQAYPDIRILTDSTLPAKSPQDSYDLALVVLYLLEMRIRMIVRDNLEPAVTLQLRQEEGSVKIRIHSACTFIKDLPAEAAVRNIAARYHGFAVYEKDGNIISSIILNHVT